MSNIYVLGAGMVGSAMAIDLAKKHHVTISDISSEVLLKVFEKEPSLKWIGIWNWKWRHCTIGKAKNKNIIIDVNLNKIVLVISAIPYIGGCT